MTNTNTPARDDAEERFSLLELDLPGKSTASAPIEAPVPAPSPASAPTCNCRSFLGPGQALPLAIRGMCPRCSRPRPLPAAAQRQPIPVTSIPSTPPANFADVQTSVLQPTSTARATHRETEVQLAASMRSGDLVAGAAADGHGVLLGFAGRGEVTRGQILAALDGADLPEAWAPRIKSAHAQAGRVLGEFNARGLVVRADRAKSGERDRAPDAPATWVARWYVGRLTSGADVGSAMGGVVVTATLMTDGTLVVDSDADHIGLGNEVRVRFAAAVAGETYAASDVTDWVRAVFMENFQAVRLGGVWFVKRQHAAKAEQFLREMSKIWGENFLLPALPVATSDQLRTGLADGLRAEVDALLGEFQALVDDAKDRRPTARAAGAVHRRLVTLVERCAHYAALLGEAHVIGLRLRLCGASEMIQEFTDDVDVRFGLIFDELARDSNK